MNYSIKSLFMSHNHSFTYNNYEQNRIDRERQQKTKRDIKEVERGSKTQTWTRRIDLQGRIGENLGALREQAVTYRGQYIHVADLQSLIYCLIQYNAVIQCSEQNATTTDTKKKEKKQKKTEKEEIREKIRKAYRPREEMR